MKDKFEILQHLVIKESNTNHYGIYISIGQLAQVMLQVNVIYDNWIDNLSIEQNVSRYFNRSISPLGGGGKNRL